MQNIRFEIPVDTTEGSEVYVYETKDSYIDEQNINKHIQELPHLVSLWNGVLARYNKAINLARIEYDIWMANNKTEIRRTIGVKTSETQVEEQVKVFKTEDYMTYEKKIADLTYYIDLIKAIVKALDSKRDMLITFGANLRAEMKNEVIIKE